MKVSDIEVSLNPIRIRALVLLSQNGQMSTAQLKEEMPDIPQATLYRHINALVKSNLIKVVQENRVRGSIERIYSVNNEVNMADPTDDEILLIGYKLILSMMGELANYSKLDDRDAKKDMLAFQAAPLYLSDEEFMNFMTEIGPIFQKYFENKPEDGRVLRNIYTVVIPKKDI